jgi:hypothetical protein
MVCQNLELQEGFNFLLRCILETRLPLTNEGLHPPQSSPRFFPLAYPLATDSCQGPGMLHLVQMVKIQCHLRRGYSLGSTPRLYCYTDEFERIWKELAVVHSRYSLIIWMEGLRKTHWGCSRCSSLGSNSEYKPRALPLDHPVQLEVALNKIIQENYLSVH